MTGAVPPPGSQPDLEAVVTRLNDEHSALRERSSRLTEDMAALVAASRDSNADDEHDPEGQTIGYERAQLSAVMHQTQAHLSEVEAALERVRTGTYGICEVCLQPIDGARLEARPTARTCVHHVGSRGT